MLISIVLNKCELKQNAPSNSKSVSTIWNFPTYRVKSSPMNNDGGTKPTLSCLSKSNNIQDATKSKKSKENEWYDNDYEDITSIKKEDSNESKTLVSNESFEQENKENTKKMNSLKKSDCNKRQFLSKWNNCVPKDKTIEKSQCSHGEHPSNYITFVPRIHSMPKVDHPFLMNLIQLEEFNSDDDDWCDFKENIQRKKLYKEEKRLYEYRYPAPVSMRTKLLSDGESQEEVLDDKDETIIKMKKKSNYFDPNRFPR